MTIGVAGPRGSGRDLPALRSPRPELRRVLAGRADCGGRLGEEPGELEEAAGGARARSVLAAQAWLSPRGAQEEGSGRARGSGGCCPVAPRS